MVNKALFQQCFGDLPYKTQKHLVDVISKMERIIFNERDGLRRKSE